MRKCDYITRLFDIILSCLALAVLLPILIPVAGILKLTGEGEIFYLQKRIGKNEEFFYIFKFATMLKDSPNIGTGNLTVLNDPRVLPFGKFLRKTKVNELPQLLNILAGHMSFIGPRPLTEDNYYAYSPFSRARISTIRPGLSGVGSIVFRDEEKLLGTRSDSKEFYQTIISPYKAELEVWFSENRSVKNYVILFVVTLYVVLYPNSKVLFDVYKDLPDIPEKLS